MRLNRLPDPARAFNGPPVLSSFHYISLSWRVATTRIQCHSSGGGGAHTYCFFCACEARSLAFSLAARAVSLARSVAVSAKVLDGVSPAKNTNALGSIPDQNTGKTLEGDWTISVQQMEPAQTVQMLPGQECEPVIKVHSCYGDQP